MGKKRRSQNYKLCTGVVVESSGGHTGTTTIMFTGGPKRFDGRRKRKVVTYVGATSAERQCGRLLFLHEGQTQPEKGTEVTMRIRYHGQTPTVAAWTATQQIKNLRASDAPSRMRGCHAGDTSQLSRTWPSDRNSYRDDYYGRERYSGRW